ncbi:MAG: NAD(P)H-dependent oxidoreductase [Winogradskyella sp.]|uniref:NAD(P)H-dependent oxidoreductase n=1 Tax=Winogradskyella sp. TaxID=1883156 RepID=UPI0017FD0A93|nr:NAD(P)H-dependent oxidoreductase [Winogradskyella sp.]MBT8245870.1 NAD(P)H-dependent oxidoreductase [Winogradskyella sp.]NNK23059.1 NAD(P)H-dependent oxidoreductase [Winogradskyella sp.]
MNVIEQLKWRYATKKFDTTKTLSSKQLTTLKEAFNLTALSYGLQTLKLVVIENKETREALVEHSYGQRQVVDSSHLLILCIQSDIDEEDVNSYFKNIIAIRNTPEAVLEPFKNQLKSTIEAMPETKKEDWAIRQAYIALGNLMTVCALEKIDSCPMEGFNPDAFDTALNLKEIGLQSVLLLPVGYRAEDDMFSTLKKVRKSIENTVIDL